MILFKHHLQFLQAGLLAIEPESGNVKAWVGGIDHEFFQFDHVRESTKRQIGSTFKPIVYAAALERGLDPCEYVSGRQTSYSNMEDWTPQNSSTDSYDKKYSMEGGLAGSVNTVSVKLLINGIDYAIGTANKMGIKSDLPNVPSIALGSPNISMLEMVSAYGVFANNGQYVEPAFVTAITDSHGQVLEKFEEDSEPVQALSESTADMMIHMLKRVVNEGTGSSLRANMVFQMILLVKPEPLNLIPTVGSLALRHTLLSEPGSGRRSPATLPYNGARTRFTDCASDRSKVFTVCKQRPKFTRRYEAKFSPSLLNC